MSPDIFLCTVKYIIPETQGMPGVVLGGDLINNLRYTDGTVIISPSEE